MKTLDKDTEKKLINATEDIIVKTQKGMSPNDAIISVIKDRNLPPLFIDRLVQAFNKSKSVHVLSTTSGDKSGTFDLANTQAIKDKLYPAKEQTSEEPKKAEKEASEFILKDFSQADTPTSLQKVASSDNKIKPMSRESIGNLLHKVASLKQGVYNNLTTEVGNSKVKMQNIISEIAYETDYLDKASLQKTAQTIINAYPETGKQLIRLVNTRLRENHKLPLLNKSANAAVLPNKPLFRFVTEAHDIAIQSVKAMNNVEAFDKLATDSFMQDFGANVLGQAVGNLGGPAQQTANIIGTSTKSAPYDAISPATYNKIQELKSRKVFMDLVLHDKRFKDYDFKDLAQAYTESTAMIPEAVDRPSLLRSLMLQHLDTGGVKDIFALGAESTIASNLAKTTSSKKDIEKAEAEIAALKASQKDKPTDVALGNALTSPFSNLLKPTTSTKKPKVPRELTGRLPETEVEILADKLQNSKNFQKNLGKTVSASGRWAILDKMTNDLVEHRYSQNPNISKKYLKISAKADAKSYLDSIPDSQLIADATTMYVDPTIGKSLEDTAGTRLRRPLDGLATPQFYDTLYAKAVDSSVNGVKKLK